MRNSYVSRGGSMNHAKLFGRRLKVLRKANKLNQDDLAEKVGIETKYLSNIETGRRSPSFEKTVALAKALEVPMSALFSFDYDEADPKILKRRIEASLARASSQQLKQIYGHVRQIIES
jgi:transcriptional regulator with XRE-family HTH domain